MLRMPKKQPSLNFVQEPKKNPDKVAEGQALANREQHKRPWMAPELYNVFLADAYTQASDVYAIGYLFEALHDFWKKGQELWMDGITHNAAMMDQIINKVKNLMLLPDAAERKSMVQIAEFFRSLKTEPARAQRPLPELSVSFNPF